MKKTYKTLLFNTVTAGFCLMAVLSASGQQRGGSSNSGSGSKSTGSTVSSSGGSASRSVAASPASYAPRPGSPAPQRSGSSIGVQRTSQVAAGRSGSVGVVRGNYSYAPRQTVAIRGNYGYAPRTAVVPAGASGYRTIPVVASNRPGFWGNHGYYYKNHGYYSTYYLPRLGYTCTALPFGYYPFFWGDNQYYYSDGLFYEYANEEYTVVEPPVGAEVTTLPDNAQSIVINGQQYYEANGVYYQPYTKDDGTQVYQVAGKDGELNTNTTAVQDTQPPAPQIGDIVNQLPDNCRKITINGQKLFVSPDGIYYQQQVDGNGNIIYKIVGLPSDGTDQN